MIYVKECSAVRVLEERMLEENTKSVSSKSFIVSGLIFRSLIHFNFLSVYDIRKCSDFFLLHMCVLVTQFCLTLCYPMDYSPPGSYVHGILQARILVWVAIPSPRDPPNPGIKPRSPTLQSDSLLSEPTGVH